MHVVITGASRGIGAALAALYTGRGDKVTGTSRRGGDGLVALDLLQPDGTGALRAAVGDAPVDLLICNAGLYADKQEQLDSGYPAQMWADELATNVTGPFLTVQALLPNLRAAGGKVAIISSQMGSSTRAKGNALIYRVSKAGALNLGLNLATALKGDGIAVGIYHPGWVQTDMGGASAEITPEASAKGLADRFDALSPATTGCFENWDGRPHAI